MIIATIAMSSNIAMPNAYSENYSEHVLAIQKDGLSLSGVSAFTFDMILGAAILDTMAINVCLTRWRDYGRD